MRSKFFLCIYLSCYLLACLCVAQEAPVSNDDAKLILSIPGEELIPAALGVRKDSNGHSWSIEQNGNLGRVGSALVNSGLQLVVNQQPFETFQPRMTRDGKEFVIYGKPIEKLKGLQIARRVRFDEQQGALRYLELFFNSSSEVQTVSIELITSCSGNYRSAITNRGNLDPLLLGDREVGVLITPGASQANRGFLFTLCGADANDKPTISAQNRYGFKFQYQLELAPGETKSIAHLVSQVVVPDRLDKETLSALFEPYHLENITSIPQQFTGSITNGSAKSVYDDPLFQSIHSVANLGVPQGDSDTLAIGEKTRLYGKATVGRFTLRSAYGKTTLSSENLIAISGKNQGLREQIRVYLNDGQVLSGEVVDGEFEFASSVGEARTISFEKLDRLVMAKQPEPDETPSQTTSDQATILTWSGDQLLLDGEDNLVFFGIGPWGDLSFTLKDLVRLIPASGNIPGYQVELTDGTNCRIFLSSRDIIVASEVLGELTLKGNQIKAVVPKQPQYSSTFLTKIRLNGNQKVAGEWLDETISIYSEGQLLSIETKEIRKVSKLTQAKVDPINPSFSIELWDGSYIEGIIRASTLPVKIREYEWQLPIASVIELDNPGPLLNSENRAKVNDLVTALGADSWAEREQATTELIQFGKLMLPMLSRELMRNPDAEVRRRIEMILNEFKEAK